MPTARAIDKLKAAFSVQELIAMNKGQEEGSLDFALQVIVTKAEDESGAKIFTAADLPALRREIPLSVLLDIMTKMQSMGEEVSLDAVKSTT